VGTKRAFTLDAQEFICRSSSTWCPKASVLYNRSKKPALTQCHKLLRLNPALPEIPKRSALELMPELTAIDLSRCPFCHQGTMVIVGELAAHWDSSSQKLHRSKLCRDLFGT
jgi:hypothetical protein